MSALVNLVGETVLLGMISMSLLFVRTVTEQTRDWWRGRK